MASTVRWGIMGTASIARRRVVPAIRWSDDGEVVAIASRDIERARQACQEGEISRAWGSYQELLDDPEVDAIYLPLPNHLHLQWGIAALKAGKHLLSEKPIALNATEARTLLVESERHPHLKVMEAFMYRFHPRWEAILSLVREGGIGTLGTVHSLFCYDNRNPQDIRNRIETGGGALLDIGCYGISVARWLFGREPLQVQGIRQFDPHFGTDSLTSGTLGFDTGLATFTCATQLPWQQQVEIVGGAGRITVERPFNPPVDHPTTFRLFRGEREEEEITFPACDQYTVMINRFNRAVLDNGPVPTPLQDAVDNMTVIDAVASGAKARRE